VGAVGETAVRGRRAAGRELGPVERTLELGALLARELEAGALLGGDWRRRARNRRSTGRGVVDRPLERGCDADVAGVVGLAHLEGVRSFGEVLVGDRVDARAKRFAVEAAGEAAARLAGEAEAGGGVAR
jgi:hypothetical protein